MDLKENRPPGYWNAAPPIPTHSRRLELFAMAIMAVLGFLILPALIALIWCGVTGIRSWRDRDRRWLKAAGAIALVAILSAGLGIGAITSFMRNMEFFWPVASLAPAVNRYYEHEHTLPDDFQGIIDSGLYGLGNYSWDHLAYLPVTKWDGKTHTVVAVVGGKGGRMGYVVLGDYSWHPVQWEELDALLAADDEARARQEEPRRWSDIDWRTPLKP
jgi:hypothetical protein